MADENDSGVDPAMMEAMGFTQFGAQAGQKRKFDGNNAFVDPTIKQSAKPATGADNTTVAQSASNLTMLNAVAQNTSGLKQKSSAPLSNQATEQPAGDAEILSRPPGDSGALRALRNGVRNTNGDMVSFLPSFIEDPWKHLETN